MLTSLTTSNFAIVHSLHLDWHDGFSAITGETGAGKSISIDALAFCLGAKSTSRNITEGEDNAVVTACFDVQSNDDAKEYLFEHGFPAENDLTLRRTLSRNSNRTRAFINGHSATNQQLKELGAILVGIHGQHAHQKLVKSNSQRIMLDTYADNQALVDSVSLYFSELRKLRQLQETIEREIKEKQDRVQLLDYQVEELDNFSPISGEYEELDSEFSRLSNGQQLMSDSASVSYALIDDPDRSLCNVINSLVSSINDLASMDGKLQPIAERFHSSAIDLDDIAKEIRDYSESVEVSPSRLQEVEQRISLYVELSRKHSVTPEQLHQTHESLAQELSSLKGKDNDITAIKEDIKAVSLKLNKAASELHSSRSEQAEQLSKLITESMQTLNMKGGTFQISIEHDINEIKEHGADNISFNVSTNPGMDVQPISDVASGGELSRLSLAMQVAVAQKDSTPTLIFDEVDVGISGNTASIVGKLLKQLGKATQVISITHLPQVASFADHHYLVSKSHANGKTNTSMKLLCEDQRTDEIARLVGGENITAESRNNARVLIEEGTSSCMAS